MWVLVSFERNGLATSEEKNPYTLTFTGDKWKLHRGDEAAVEGTVRLVDVATTPRKFGQVRRVDRRSRCTFSGSRLRRSEIPITAK